MPQKKGKDMEDYRRWERRVEKKTWPIPILAILLFCVLLSLWLGWFWLRTPQKGFSPGGLTRFTSEEEFSEYLSKSQEWFGSYWTIGSFWGMKGAYPAIPRALGEGEERVPRVSETTVQVKGIDEPDVVKTDGRYLYFSGYWNTKAIRAFPPSELSVVSRLERNGELFLLENMLVLLSDDGITCYEVSDPSSPKELWRMELEAFLLSARLYRGKIYLITQSPVEKRTPLPLQPLKTEKGGLLVRAEDIYHPPYYLPVDSVYTASILDPKEGRVERSVSFVGSSGTSVVYMSRTSLYLAYTHHLPPLRLYHDFLKRCGDLLPPGFMERMEKVMGYELSDTAKLVELEFLLSSAELPREELWKRWEGYLTERRRELENTHVVKIALENFDIVAQAEVPGRLLNQFSLDEEGGYLRLATTVEPWMLGWRGESTNDVYVLDQELKVVGSLKDIGVGEEIYAVRFLGSKGYVVTFKETDPLHVIDLSNPHDPRVVGELKMPGYSSYLHPISESLLLGIGKEEWKVKVSLFDVSSPSQPTELDRLLLDEYWSEILETHHAFLLDQDHEIFFLPTPRKGYVISYAGSDLRVVGLVENVTARRAVYLDDYLYVISEERVTVLDERTWETVNEIEL